MVDRYTINQKLINEIPDGVTGSPQQCIFKVLGLGLNVLMDISTNLAIIADTVDKDKTGCYPDNEKPDDDKETLNYYVSECSNCGRLAPIGDYCIWCGEKGTLFNEGGDPE